MQRFKHSYDGCQRRLGEATLPALASLDHVAGLQNQQL